MELEEVIQDVLESHENIGQSIPKEAWDVRTFDILDDTGDEREVLEGFRLSITINGNNYYSEGEIKEYMQGKFPHMKYTIQDCVMEVKEDLWSELVEDRLVEENRMGFL